MPKYLFSIAAFCCLITPTYGIGPQHILVLVRQDSQESLEVANHYRLKRGIPPQNFVYLDYKGPPQRASQADFLNGIQKPVHEHIKNHQLEKRIHAWITTPGLPYRVENNSISSLIHFGQVFNPKKSDQLGPAGFEEKNEYVGSWLAINAYHGMSNAKYRPLHMHLWAGSVPATCDMIDRSAGSDGKFPKGTRYLCDGDGPRASRAGTIAPSIRFLNLLDAPTEHRIAGEFRGKEDIIGLFTGCIRFPVQHNRFLPGAIADHLTSLGGVIDVPSGQMSSLDFLTAGCSATYGTVVEPFNYPHKFPTAMTHVAYAAGFTAMESYWLGVLWPQQGIFAGDPLTRPFGLSPEVKIISPQPLAIVGESAKLDIRGISSAQPTGVGMFDVWIENKQVASLGQRRLPKEASIAITVGEKKYIGTSNSPSSVIDLTTDVRKKLVADGFDVSFTPASLFIYRKPGKNPGKITATTTSTVLHAHVVGNRFHPGKPIKPGEKVDDDPAREHHDFAWVRFGTGPSRVAAKFDLSLKGVSDGLHYLRVAGSQGSEALAPRLVEVPIIKRTHATRLRLSAVASSITLNTSNPVVAEAKWEGGSGSGVEFRVNERPVKAMPGKSGEVVRLVIDPKEFGVGHHRIRARGIADGTKAVQEADEAIEITIKR